MSIAVFCSRFCKCRREGKKPSRYLEGFFVCYFFLRVTVEDFTDLPYLSFTTQYT